MLANLNKILGAALRASPENPSTNLNNPASWLVDWATGGRSASGIPVTEEKAYGVATAYACVNLIAKTVATLPLHVFRRRGALRELVTDNEFGALIGEQPNPLMTSVVWREVMLAHVLLWGNHYSIIADDGRGRPPMLLPLQPWNVDPVLTSDSLRKKYRARMPDGTVKEFREDQILHIPGLTFDGITGISPIRKLRNTYGLSLATEQFGSKFFANDARPGVIMEVPSKMGEQAQKNLVQSMHEKFAGSETAWKLLVLEEGAKMHMVQMPLQDAQFLETQKLQDARICGTFGTPPHLVGIIDKSTSWGTGIEQQDIGYAKHCIRPWCVKIEAELDRKLFRGDGLICKFSLEGLQRGDFKSRMVGYQIGVQNGIYLRNEVRELEDLPPLEGGNVALIPANMTTMDKLNQPLPAVKGTQA